MPLPSPGLVLTKVSKNSFNAAVTTSPGLFVDLYVKNPISDLDGYSFYASRSGSGNIVVSSRVPYSYQFSYAVARDSSGNLSLPTFNTVDLNSSNSLNSAIRQHWYSNGELTGKFKGGLFVNEVPENVDNKPLVMPYCMFRNDQSDFTFTMGPQYFESSEIDFVVFAPGAAVMDECLDMIQKHFDFQQLPFADYYEGTISIMPTSRSMTSENFRYKDGNLIFRGSLNYDIVITRVR